MTKRKGDFRARIDRILAEGETPPPASGKAAGPVAPTTESKTDRIEIDKIFLPAGRKPDQDVSELLSSVRSKGVLQPVLLRPVGNRFEVVDGARRLVAAQQTGRKSVPAEVRKLSAAEARAMSSRDRPIVARSARAGRAAAAGGALAVGAAAATATGGARKVGTASTVSKLAAKPAVKPATRLAATAAATPIGKGAIKPAASKRARTAARLRPGAQTSAEAGKIFGDAAPKAAEEAVAFPVPAAAPTAVPASTRVAFPHLPELEKPEAWYAAAAATPVDAVPEPRPGKSKAMAGWYVFLAALAAASFSVTNLAINHDTSLSIGTGMLAGVGLVAVVILLVTGR